MSSLWKIKDESYITIGLILLILFGLFFFVGISMIPEEEIGLVMMTIFIFFLIFGLPGIYLFRRGVKARKRQDKLEKLSRYLHRDKKIRVKKLARVIGENELETESLLEEGMEKDLFEGCFEEEDEELIFVNMSQTSISNDYSYGQNDY